MDHRLQSGPPSQLSEGLLAALPPSAGALLARLERLQHRPPDPCTLLLWTASPLGLALSSPAYHHQLLQLHNMPTHQLPLLVQTLAPLPLLTRLSGPSSQLDHFLPHWQRVHSCLPHTLLEQRTMVLTTLQSGPATPGRLRPMQSSDLPTIARWLLHFHREIKHFTPYCRQLARHQAWQKLKAGTLWIWDVRGHARAMASVTQRTSSRASLAGIFTPVAARGHGYGRAITTALTRHLLDQGLHTITLATDVGNQAAVALYQRVGFQQDELISLRALRYTCFGEGEAQTEGGIGTEDDSMETASRRAPPGS